MNGLMFIVNIILITLSILSIIGLIYLTQFSFNAKIHNGEAKVKDMDKNKLIFSKITVSLLWIQIVLVIFSSIWVATQSY
jgi:hypothetical protein